MNSASLLRNDDRCQRLAILNQSWERNALAPIDILRRSVDFGLQSDADDPGVAAGDEHFRICTSREIDTDSFDLIGIADHGASLANFIVWLIRADNPPWEHPEDVKVGSQWWESAAYLSQSHTRLRQVWITDRWDLTRQIAAEHSWFVQGECAAYGLSMDLLVVVIGSRRDHRWHSPLTVGWLHPVNQDLRFQKRNGEGFGGNWERTYRESFKGSREDWLDAMTEDNLLAESLIVTQAQVPPERSQLRTLAERKLETVNRRTSLPDPQLSQCDSAQAPCQFRSTCPFWRLPSEELGFLKLQPSPQSPHPEILRPIRS